MADETQGKGEGTADFLTRIARGLLDRMGPGGGAGPAAAPPAGPPLDPRLAPHGDKVTTAAEAVAHIPGGSHVFVGTACATPRALVAALESMPAPPADLELVHFITNGAVPHDGEGRATTRFRHRTIFVGSDMQAAVRQGLAEYVPMSVARVPQLIAIGRIRVRVRVGPARAVLFDQRQCHSSNFRSRITHHASRLT